MFRFPRMRLLLTILIGALALAAPVRAELDFTVLGNGFTGRPYVVRNDIVLETTGLGEGIRDFSDLKNPRWLGWNSHEFTFRWDQVLTDGSLVVGINREYGAGPVGFSVNDFSNPSDASELSIITGFSGETGWMRDGALLLCDDYLGVTYDLADPASPQFATVFLMGTHEGDRYPAADGNILFLVDEGSMIRVLDVTDPRFPADLGTASTMPGRIDGMAAGEGYLHLLVANDASDGKTALDLVTFDVANPLAPILTGRQRLGSRAGLAGLAFVKSRDLLLVSTADLGVQAFGLEDPAFPAPGWILHHDSDHLQISATAIFIKTESELFVYERTPHDSVPDQRIHRTVLPDLRNVTGEGPIQFAQVENALLTLDVSDPHQPRVEKPLGLELWGTLLYADGVGVMRESDTLDFRLLDLEDPRNPQKLGEILVPGPYPHAGAFSGDVLAINFQEEIPKRPNWYRRMVNVYDCRDPLLPRLTGLIDGNAARFCDGEWLLCGWSNPIRVYRLDEDLAPVHFADLESELDDIPISLVIKDFVYLVGSKRSGSFEFEVHRLGAEPTLVTSRTLDRMPRMVNHHRGFLYIQSYRECYVYDVTDPTSPLPIGSFPSIGGMGFATNGDVVTVSSNLITVQGHGATPTHTPALSMARGVRMDPARPNPFNPLTNISFAIDRARELTVDVHDSRGRLVRRLASEHFPAGTHAVSWNGEAQGAPAASGVYFVRIHGEGTEAVQAVTLLK